MKHHGPRAGISPLAEHATETDRPSPRRSAAASLTVLVIDDEIDARAALCDALVDAGYRVFLAANGKEGLHHLPGLQKPLGVILDLTMPLMNGVELYEIMKATPALADIPVVISTSDPERAPKGVPLLKKPVSLERLLETVAQLF
jgi:CheY-like chemotaxis protein